MKPGPSTAMTDLRPGGERGAIAILFSLLVITILGITALAVDLSTFSQRKQALWNTTDAAALAGVSQLPGDYEAAAALAIEFALRNNPDLNPSDVNVTYRCVIGDRDGDGLPDLGDIPAACDPGPDVSLGDWVCDGDLCYAPCFPADGDVCNTIVVGGTDVVDFAFAGVLGINEGVTSVVSAACIGFCGGPPTGPLDLMLVLDRTGSMDGSKLRNAKDAALAVLRFLNSNSHHVGLTTLGAADPGNPCQVEEPDEGGVWLAVPLSNDYQMAQGQLNRRMAEQPEQVAALGKNRDTAMATVATLRAAAARLLGEP